MDPRFRFEDHSELLESLADDLQAKIRTAIPVRLVEDSDGHTVKLQPLVKAVVRSAEGKLSQVNLPVISDVPINHHGGGGVTVTYPHKQSDEGIFLVSDRSLDAWHQQGGIQGPADARMHSLSDGFYIPGVRNSTRKLKNVSTSAVETRSDDGKHKISMDAKTGATTISVDDGKHVLGLDPKGGISMKTAMALAIDASKGMNVKGKTHFSDAVTSATSFGAPKTFSNGGGIFTGMMGGIVGALLCLGTLMALSAAGDPHDGIQRASYVLAAWVR